MRILDKFLLRLRSLFHRDQVDSQLDAELNFHLDQLTEENIAAGMTPQEARQAAQRSIGNSTHWQEACRDTRRVNLLDDFLQDLRFAIRTLKKTPAFTAVVVATLALGIGATIAIFTIVNGALLRPLAYPQPDQLTHISAQTTSGPGHPLSAAEYFDFRQFNQSFSAVGAYSTGGSAYTTAEVNITTGDRPLRVRSIAVDSHLFKTLRLQPQQGRLFRDEETSHWTGTLPPPIAILSHELWTTAFAQHPLLGQKLTIEGRPHEIVGIMPPAADLMDNHTQIWLPLWLHPQAALHREAHLLHLIARRKANVTPEEAQAELNTLLQNWAARANTTHHVPTHRPIHASDHTLHLRSLQDAVVGSSSQSLWVLQAAVALVFLIVCANLANLVMARAGARQREFALRTSLGASTARLLRQALTEASLLSIGGSLLGLWLANLGLAVILRAYPTTLPRASELKIDTNAFLLAFAVTIATSIFFGLLSLQRTNTNGLIASLKDGAKGSTNALRNHARRALVAAQIALAVMLVLGAGLLLQTVQNLTQIDAGFNPSRLVTFSLTMPMANSDADTRATAYQSILRGLLGIPGIGGAAAMSGLPPHRSPDSIATPIENYIAEDGKPVAVIDYYQFVIGDFFDAMRIPIVKGQPFTQNATARQVIVNESLAKKLWPSQNPLGKRLRPPGATFGASTNDWHTIVGVAKDVRQQGLDRPAAPELYLSLDQHALAPPTMNLVLRTTLPPTALATTLERVISDIDSSIPLVRLRDMDSVFAESIRRPRLLAQLLSAFAALALLLAAIGTYGVLSFMVTERRREIGIRLALGALRSQVLAHIMKQSLQLTALGIALGLTGAAASQHLVASLLYGIQPADPITILAVILVILAIAALASWLPAWRASRVDPNIALRNE